MIDSMLTGEVPIILAIMKKLPNFEQRAPIVCKVLNASNSHNVPLRIKSVKPLGIFPSRIGDERGFELLLKEGWQISSPPERDRRKSASKQFVDICRESPAPVRPAYDPCVREVVLGAFPDITCDASATDPASIDHGDQLCVILKVSEAPL